MRDFTFIWLLSRVTFIREHFAYIYKVQILIFSIPVNLYKNLIFFFYRFYFSSVLEVLVLRKIYVFVLIYVIDSIVQSGGFR